MMSNWESLVNFFALLLVLLHAMIIILMSLRVIMKRRPASVSLAWLAVIYALPFAGMALYVVFGELYLGKKRVQRATTMLHAFMLRINQWALPLSLQVNDDHSRIKPLRSIIAKRFLMPTLVGNQLTLLTESELILEQIAADITAAKKTVYMEFYICSVDGQVELIADALINAAQRGVDCRVLLDSVGSAAFFSTKWPTLFCNAGIQLTEVLPVGPMRIFFHRQDLRMHRKLIAIDNKIAYTGSMNLVDPTLFKPNSGLGEWVDIMIRMQGPIVSITGSILEWDWEIETGEKFTHRHTDMQHDIETYEESSRVQVIPSGPYFNDDNLQQVLISAIYLADNSIILTTPYFVPDEALNAAIKAASIRGVDVKIILPKKNDSHMANFASRGFFEELLACGVEIYQHEHGLLHTKSILIDNQWCLVGTVNLDKRSVWLNFEVTLLIDHSPFILQLYQLQLFYIENSKKVLLSEWKKRSWLERVLENLFYLFNPLL